jgi:lipopolysaccharide/colanic/teichoic acid biosynthesis glycosyltransferase
MTTAKKNKIYAKYFKRLFDLILATLLLIVLSPIFLACVIALLLANRGDVFFVHNRPGQHEKPFNLLKFKTMNDKKDEAGNLLPDKDRMTKPGKIIRKLSLDELPQFINVLKGDMSLIGPRPLLFKYIPLYSEEQRRRHEVKPGITGLAQIKGRNAISWTQKFKYDVEYVDNVSFSLDMKIFWLTIKKVLTSEGVNQTEERPMMPFDGSN